MRKSKLTTVGLMNPGNHCFANANLQALASLPLLYTYLNELGYLVPENADILEAAPLSVMLRRTLLALNEQVTAAKTISPWPFLTTLETVYRSRLSRSQHDAHELLHLILETLDTENARIRKLAASKFQSPRLVPDLVFRGTVQDIIQCTQCGTESSKLGSFLVLSLMVPQDRSATLAYMLQAFQSPELISGYGCVVCRVKSVLALPPGVVDKNPQLKQLQESLANYAEDPGSSLSLPPELEAQLPTEVTSTIKKSTRIKELPEVLVIHLSRSIYASTGASRNSCRVSTPETLEITGQARVGGSPDLKTVSRRYRLFSLVKHSGSHYMGHYEANRRYDPFWESVQASDPAHTGASGPRGSNEPATPVSSVSTASSPQFSARSWLSSEPDSMSFENTTGDESQTEDPTPRSSFSFPLGHSSKGTVSAASARAHDALAEGATEVLTTEPVRAGASEHADQESVRSEASGVSGAGVSGRAPRQLDRPRRGERRAERRAPEFWTVSDAEVREAKLSQVLGQESAAYMVFYQRVSDRVVY